MCCKDMKGKLQTPLPVGAHSLILQRCNCKAKYDPVNIQKHKRDRGKAICLQDYNCRNTEETPQILYLVGRLS